MANEGKKPEWIALITSIIATLLAVGVAYGTATRRISELEKRVEFVETTGAVPVARIEQKIDAIKEQVVEIKEELRELRAKK